MSGGVGDILRFFPSWLIVGGAIYLVILLTIAVFWGREVQFWPPKVGPRAQVGDNHDAEYTDSEYAKLRGKWYLYFGYDTARSLNRAVGEANIEIRGRKFEMKLHLTRTKRGRMTDNQFEYEGEIKDGQIVARYSATRPIGSSMRGAVVLYLSPRGDRLFGAAVYVNRYNKIVVDRFLLMRS